MAKFIKSIFQSPAPEKRISSEKKMGETEDEGAPPISDKRKLSMSRSGRLKQAYKKRHSLSLELYGSDNDMQSTEKPKSMEYHVHTPPNFEPQKEKTKRKPVDPAGDIAIGNGTKSPEEEIDRAFDIIDKS